MPISNAQKELLQTVRNWLKELGYEPDPRTKNYLRFTEKMGDTEFVVIVRPIDDQTVEFITAYQAEPTGDPSSLNKWKDNIFKRRWGEAAMGLRSDKDEQLIVVWKHFTVTAYQEADKGRLFFVLYSIREYFRCWEYDIDFAEELNLVFPDIDANALLK